MLGKNGEIALSLSGGGVRALGYHLGTMDYLNRIGWLEKVSILSSVSGGSMTAIGYALAKKKQLSFEDFYGQIFEFLPKLNTMEMIFENLAASKPVAASGRRDLITCWAEVYRQAFFEPYYDDPSLDIFWNGPETHLKEVIFNAVEMKTGVAFRFQHSDNTNRFKVGNGNLWLQHEHARKMKMSDVMASSSCLPGGMEPLQLPADYRWPDDHLTRQGSVSRKTCDEVEKHLRDTFGEDAANIAIFDGGIYDNQTISSVLLALSRAHGRDFNTNQHLEGAEPSVHDGTWHDWFGEVLDNYTKQADPERLGLYIISDAVVRHDPMFEPDPENCIPGKDASWLRRRTLGQLNNAALVISVALLISAAVNLTDFFVAGGFSFTDHLQTTLVNVVSTLIPGLVAAAILLILIATRRLIKKEARAALERMPKMKRPFWSLIKGLRLGNLWDMVTVRASSLSVLVSRFYMHRTRQLEYSIVYKNEKLRNKIVTNEIYRLLDPPEGLVVAEDLKAVVTVGANLPTKIWINEVGDQADDAEILKGRNDLQVLVATGQATIIANLLNRVDNDADLRDTLQRDWALINQDPFHFVDNR
jgi:hypothetical protein